jgi:tryptophan synthase alpha chain
MNDIDETFSRLKKDGSTALIPFLTVGDPDIETTVALIRELASAGADMIELGVPYSDPLADGPVIQRASERALSKKITTLIDVIQVAQYSRENGINIPFILFTYYNPVLQQGVERIFQLLQSHHISGIIIPDLPFEEDHEIRLIADKYGIHLIPLVAPTSQQRIEKIVRQARGFVYCVSSLGVTGERTTFFSNIDHFLDQVRRVSSVPLAVGFGISSREQVEKFEQKCDGVIVGSAIVRQIEKHLVNNELGIDRAEGVKQVGNFVRNLKGLSLIS